MASNDAPPYRSVNDYDGESALRMALMQLDLTCKNERDEAPPPEEDARQDESPVRDEWDWVLHRGDKTTGIPQSVAEEVKRLQALKSYMILDSEREAAFDRLTSLATRVFDVPIALVSLVDVGRQWFMSNLGLGDVRQTSRKLAFCAHAIQHKSDIFIVPDATKDSRFSESALVVGHPYIRFYAGVPLVSTEGYKLGTFCIIDTKPRPNGLTETEKANLRDFASMTADTMEKRRQLRASQENNGSRNNKNNNKQDTEPTSVVAAAAHDQLAPLKCLQSSLEALAADESVTQRLTPSQNKHLAVASKTADILRRISLSTVNSLSMFNKSAMGCNFQIPLLISKTKSSPCVEVGDLFQILQMLTESIVERVPIHLSLDSSVPTTVVVDDLIIIRCALNLLSQSVAKTESGFVRGKMSAKGQELYFQCEDTGRDATKEEENKLFCSDTDSDIFLGDEQGDAEDKEASTDLRSFSLTSQIESIGGKYGFRRRQEGDAKLSASDAESGVAGSIAWFSLPIALPKRASNDKCIRCSVTIEPRAKPAAKRKSNRQLKKSRSKATPKIETIDENYTVNEDAPHTISMDTEDSLKNTPDAPSKARSKSMPVATRAGKESLKAPEQRSPAASPVRPDEERIRKALVIEDSDTLRKCLSRGFTKLGFEVVEAIDGAEGLKALKETRFDIALCGFVLPNIDGLDCVKQYRDWESEQEQSAQRQCIIGISANSTCEQDVEKGRVVGMDAVKAKPITTKVIRELVQKLDAGDFEKDASKHGKGALQRAGSKRSGADSDLEVHGKDNSKRPKMDGPSLHTLSMVKLSPEPTLAS